MACGAEIALERVKDSDKLLFANLFNLYHHDRAKFFPELYTAVDEEGYYDKAVVAELLAEPPDKVQSFFIKYGDNVAGLVVLVMPPYVKPGCDYGILEIFVLNNFRGKGIARGVCKLLFNKFPGRYCAMVAENDVDALGFWDKIIPASGNLLGREKNKEELIVFEWTVER